VSGTTNQIDCTPTTGAVVCGLATTITTPGTLDLGANTLVFTDTTLTNDGANTLAQKNGANGQAFRIYNTDVAGANDEYFELNWQLSGNTITLLTNKTGTGVSRPYRFAYPAFPTISALQIGASINGGILVSYGTTASSANSLGRMDIGNLVNNTSPSGTSIDLRIRENFAPTATSTMVAIPLSIEPTINYSNATPGAGSYEAIHIGVTETALPTGTSYLLRALGGVAAATAIWSVTNTGNETLAGTLTSSRTTDLGWSIVNATNQACNTTCTSACVFGFNTAAIGNLLPCTDATADSCLCAGAS
jgi:hypothetical protein